jgi:AraC-like DNA-binding protein
MSEASSGAWIEASPVDAGWIEIEGPTVLEVGRGEILVRGGDELVRVGVGSLVCVSSGVRCGLRAPCGGARVERLVVDRGFVERVLQLERPPGRSEDGPGFLVDPCGTDRACRGRRLLREIAAAGLDAEQGARLRLVARCVELLAMTFEAPTTPVPVDSSGRGSGRRERFLRAVEDLAREPLDEATLPAFARRAGLSARHASRLFQLEIGRTFREHVSELRLERAKQLLRSTGMSVIEVAGETGWSSLAHFNSVFRRRVGSTPSRFRVQGCAAARRGLASGLAPAAERAMASTQAARGASPV